MAKQFTKKTYTYFDQAKKNKNNPQWFEKNKTLYEENVKEPFSYLLTELQKKIGSELIGIDFNPRILTRPLRPKNKINEGGLIKSFSHFTAWEKRTSLFEWNPGIYMQLGSAKDENLIGIGLYMVSSRQLSLLRQGLVQDHDEIHDILNQRQFKKTWGTLRGEKYKRFPKGYSPDDTSTEYLWHKQFYIGQDFTRQEVISKKFIPQLVHDIKLALPLFKWIRKTVGTSPARRRINLD